MRPLLWDLPPWEAAAEAVQRGYFLIERDLSLAPDQGHCAYLVRCRVERRAVVEVFRLEGAPRGALAIDVEHANLVLNRPETAAVRELLGPRSRCLRYSGRGVFYGFGGGIPARELIGRATMLVFLLAQAKTQGKAVAEIAR